MSQTNARHDLGSTAPRWLKVFGIVALVLLHLFIVLHLADPDRYGAGRHTPLDHGVQLP